MLPIHATAALFPELSGDALSALAEDIRTHGLRHPIVTHDGAVLDGRNRQLACKLAGVEPRYVEWDGTGDPTSWVLSTNLHRRHLDTSQRALVGARLARLYSPEARQRQGVRTDLRADFPESERGRARDRAAREVGVSSRSVEHASRVLSKGIPGLVALVDAAQLPVSVAAQIAAQLEDLQEKAIALAEGAESRRAASEKVRAFLEEQTAKAPSHPINLSDGSRAPSGETPSSVDRPTHQSHLPNLADSRQTEPDAPEKTTSSEYPFELLELPGVRLPTFLPGGGVWLACWEARGNRAWRTTPQREGGYTWDAWSEDGAYRVNGERRGQAPTQATAALCAQEALRELSSDETAETPREEVTAEFRSETSPEPAPASANNDNAWSEPLKAGTGRLRAVPASAATQTRLVDDHTPPSSTGKTNADAKPAEAKAPARSAGDAYYTPAALASACVAALAPVWSAQTTVHEPHVGGGAFLDAMTALDTPPQLSVSDINGESPGLARARSQEIPAWRQDFLQETPVETDWIVGNPPYNEAEAHVRRALLGARVGVAFLLQLSFLGSLERIPFFDNHPPTFVYAVQGRPRFHRPDGAGGSGSAAQEYALFVWVAGHKAAPGEQLRWLRWSKRGEPVPVPEPITLPQAESTDSGPTLLDPVLCPELSIFAPWRRALVAHPLATVRRVLSTWAHLDGLYFAVNGVRPTYKTQALQKADYILRHLGVTKAALAELDSDDGAPTSPAQGSLLPPEAA